MGDTTVTGNWPTRPLSCTDETIRKTILVVDDHAVLRYAIVEFLLRHPSIQIVGQARDGMEAVRMAGELKPDVVIMDVHLPGLNGIDATRAIKSDLPSIEVIALSMYDDPVYMECMLNAGAACYVNKDEITTTLLDKVMGGA